MTYKYLLILSTVISCSFQEQPNIKLDDIQLIRIIDHINHNYETATFREYNLEIQDKEALLFDTRKLSRSDYLEIHHNMELAYFEHQIEIYEDSIYNNRNDKELKLRYETFLDFTYDSYTEWYDDYINNITPIFIKTVSESILEKLVSLLNKPPVDFVTFHKKYNTMKNDSSNYNELDSLIILLDKPHFCYYNFSFYPTVAIDIITQTDTIQIYSTCQNDPPLPWIIKQNNVEIETYNNGFNELLYQILPEQPIINRNRLKKDVQLLIQNN